MEQAQNQKSKFQRWTFDLSRSAWMRHPQRADVEQSRLHLAATASASPTFVKM
jgi:hypothetical protein